MNTIRELTEQEKYNTMLKRKNREIKTLRQENAQIGMLNADLSIYLKEHKARIDKAIEYIEQKKLQPRLRTANTYSLQERQLLDILKGSDNNE